MQNPNQKLLGMYRENSKGVFNVPFGKYKNPAILNEENIMEVSEALKNVELTSVSFEQAVSNAKEGDFVYFDPPYYPLSKTSSFTNYHENAFLEEEQTKLRDVIVELDKRECFIMLSNSYTKFIDELYDSHFNRKIIMANRAINCKADGRGKIKEFLILNYKR